MYRQNHNRRLSGAITALILSMLLSVTLVVKAQPPTLQGTHDVSEESPGSYRITGADPYFVLPVGGARVADAALLLSIAIEDPRTTDRAVPVELFFSASDQTAGAVFDPAFRFKFRLPTSLKQTFELPLSPDIALTAGQLARLDIDACRGCLVRLTSDLRLAKLASVTESGDTLRLAEYRLYNGFKSVPADGLEISLSDWLLHDLEVGGGSGLPNSMPLSQTGNDPFLVSPLLDIRADTFGGVLIELDAPFSPALSTASIYDFQIFYATEAHAFIEPASSILRLAVNTDAAGDVNKLQFLVPLDFLSMQSPPIEVLQRLRLDLPQTAATDAESRGREDWLLRSIKLINLQQLSQYQHLIPPQLVHSKRQRASGTQTLRGIFIKISRDPGFGVVYVLLLMLVLIITTRKFRKTLNRD